MVIQKQKNIAGIVLSAGRSERMGAPKFSLRFSEHTTFVEKIANEFALFGCSAIIIVLNQDDLNFFNGLNLNLPKNTKIVINRHYEWGRFYSLKVAVNEVAIGESALISNIDNPFLSVELLSTLLASSNGYDYASPAYEGRGGHPFYLSSKVLSDIRAQSNNNIFLKSFLSQYPKKSIPVDDARVLVNINTKEDFEGMGH